MECPTSDAKELEAIEKFRQNVADVLNPDDTDHYLYRWLTYANFDLEESERTLRTCMLCRLCQQVDKLPDIFVIPEVWKRYGFSDFIGYDNDGIPVRYMPVGRADFDGLLRSVSTVTMDLLCACLITGDLRLLRQKDKKNGKIRDVGQSVIFDLDGFSLQQFAHKHVLECLIDLMKMYQEYYTAGVLKLIVIINAPFYYPLVLNLFRPILRRTIIDKIKIFSKASTPDMMLKIMDENELPAFLGGKKIDENGDPRCSAFVGQGGKIPEKYYYLNGPQTCISGPDVLDISIRARSHYDHSVEILSPGTIIRIHFQSNNSVGLSVHYKAKDPLDAKYAEICCSPYSRIQSHLVPEEMDLMCPKPGTYTFRFDNSYCWTTAKHLLLKVKILPAS